MKLFTLRRILPAMLILLSFTASASDNAVKPLKVKFAHAPFVASVKTYETEYNKKYVLKVCACQMMTVQSNNEQIENIAVFSEKVNNGDLTADFAVATQVLEKEKKHMKSQFYNKMKVTGKQIVATDCKTFYNQLKVQYKDLKVYEMLDADAISRFDNLNK